MPKLEQASTPPRLLIAEDDPNTRTLLTILLQRWGLQALATADGEQAWAAMQRPDCPDLLLLDWMMPRLDGLELCQRARDLERAVPFFIILLTALDRKTDVSAGFEAGADDYVTKPFDAMELRARVEVGLKVTALQRSLILRLAELQHALDHVKTLQGLLPICMYCHKIRDNDSSAWEQIDTYLMEHTEAQLSHGLCPECAKQGLR